MSVKFIDYDQSTLYLSTVELDSGIIKAVMGFRQFLLRGIDSVQGEWDLVCIAGT